MTLLKKTLAVLTMAAASMGVQAEGITIGTGVLADIGGVYNAYVEMDVSTTGALSFEVASVTDFNYGGSVISGTGLALAYKYSPEAQGLYFKGGLANITVSSGTASAGGIMPMALVGWEQQSGQLVYGVEGGWGTTAGMGMLNLYIGFEL